MPSPVRRRLLQQDHSCMHRRAKRPAFAVYHELQRFNIILSAVHHAMLAKKQFLNPTGSIKLHET